MIHSPKARSVVSEFVVSFGSQHKISAQVCGRAKFIAQEELASLWVAGFGKSSQGKKAKVSLNCFMWPSHWFKQSKKCVIAELKTWAWLDHGVC